MFQILNSNKHLIRQLTFLELNQHEAYFPSSWVGNHKENIRLDKKKKLCVHLINESENSLVFSHINVSSIMFPPGNLCRFLFLYLFPHPRSPPTLPIWPVNLCGNDAGPCGPPRLKIAKAHAHTRGNPELTASSYSFLCKRWEQGL